MRPTAPLGAGKVATNGQPQYMQCWDLVKNHKKMIFFVTINARRLFNIFIFGQKFWPDLLFSDAIKYSTSREKQYNYVYTVLAICVVLFGRSRFFIKNHDFSHSIIQIAEYVYHCQILGQHRILNLLWTAPSIIVLISTMMLVSILESSFSKPN